MPIYDFRCQECGKVSEFMLLSSTDSRILTCSGCGSQSLERLISGSRVLKERANAPGTTCCGRAERCEAPPCSTDRGCHRH